METSRLEQQLDPQRPQILSPCSSGRRSGDSNSPEFEFWMVRNPSFPQPNLLSADELFVDGVVLPLHLIHHHHQNSCDPPDPHLQPSNQETTTSTSLKPPPESGPELSTADSSSTALTASKRWKDIFKKSDGRKSQSNNNEDKEKEKKKDRKSGTNNGASSAELNINIWPFSRSRSAGNGGNRPKMVAGSAATRKVSSAPCSRSNSAGESKSRKWPSSPSRNGVHLGRSSPVWQVRRGVSGGRSSEPVVRNAEKAVKREGKETRRHKAANAGGGWAEAKVLNVPMCIGYRHHLSCRSDENSAVAVAATGSSSGVIQSAGTGSGDGGRVGSFDHRIHTYAYGGQQPKPEGERFGLFSIPVVLAGLFGVGLLDIAHADADEATAKTPPPSESPSSHVDLEETAKKERHRLEELLKSKGMQYGSYPRFTVAVKGQKVTIKFQIPPTCEIPLLIANLVSRLGLKVEDRGVGSDMTLRAWDSAVSWQLSLTYPEKQKALVGDQGLSEDTNAHDGDLCILMFRSLISSDKAEIEFMKKGSFSSKELDALASVLQLAGPNKTLERKSKGDTSQMPSAEKSIAGLEAMGVKIYGLNEPNVGSSRNEISWDNIAGYNEQKREIEDTILLALRSPEVYDDIARGTRSKFETNRPRAVLFEGPPGTGKTSCARVIAYQAGVPLLYVPLEIVMSKYYGESERLLGKVFSLANELPNGAIVFLDEIDSFAVARDSETHEATRRILSVILRQIDGFEQEKKVVVIAATNRKQDLDPALISRFDSMITFGLPDQQNRQEIAAQYAKHLTKSELAEFATVTEEMSGRDIRDVCQQGERHWASKIIRGQADTDAEHVPLPPLQEYIESAMNRRRALLSVASQKDRNVFPPTKKPQLDMI